MDNLFTILALLAMCKYSTDKKLLLIMAAACSVAIAIDLFVGDIALYYAINALVASCFAYLAIKLTNGDSGKVYATILITQAILCISLVPGFSGNVNYCLEFALLKIGNAINLIVIALGVINCDKILLYLYNSDNCLSFNGDNRRGNDN